MGRFVYRVRYGAGASDTGVLDAASAEEAYRLLRREGKTVVDIHEETAPGADLSRSPTRGKRVRRDDVIFFATQLAVLVDTGVPLSESLDAIAEQTDHAGLRAVVHDLGEQVKGGATFSAALDKHPAVFSRLFVSMMRASEASGTMGNMLTRLSEYLANEREVRKRIKGALVYPACMLSFCVLVVIGLLAFVLPRFEKIYAGKGAALPLPTRMLLAMSNTLVGYWPIILAALAAVIVALRFYLRTPAGRLLVDRLRISTPIIGPMYRKACLARSLRSMATMVSTGVSMLEGLEITAEVAGNQFYRNLWVGVREKVKEGSAVSDELFACDIVPRTVAQMISAGERTGRLAQVMNRVAQFCEDDLKVAIKTVTQMIEPIMIMIMGLLIGGIAIALLLPIFSISKVVAR